MNNQPSSALLQALAVCAELTGTDLSQAAIRVMAQDLSQYPENQILGALSRCRKELKSRLTLADIISRIDDGRPGPQEAWSIVAPTLNNESITIIWTAEMAQAYGVASKIENDNVASRMAFIESYQSLVQKARDQKRAVQWTPCLGHDQHGRNAPIMQAIDDKRLSFEYASQFLSGPAHEIRRLQKSLEIKALVRDFATDEGMTP